MMMMMMYMKGKHLPSEELLSVQGRLLKVDVVLVEARSTEALEKVLETFQCLVGLAPNRRHLRWKAVPTRASAHPPPSIRLLRRQG